MAVVVIVIAVYEPIQSYQIDFLVSAQIEGAVAMWKLQPRPFDSRLLKNNRDASRINLTISSVIAVNSILINNAYIHWLVTGVLAHLTACLQFLCSFSIAFPFFHRLLLFCCSSLLNSCTLVFIICRKVNLSGIIKYLDSHIYHWGEKKKKKKKKMRVHDDDEHR